jgi:hypothetical protein
VTQVYRFAAGRKEAGEDADAIEGLVAAFREQQRFDELLLDLVSTEAFGYRLEQ